MVSRSVEWAAEADELVDLRGRLARRFLFPSKATRHDAIPLVRQEVRLLLAVGQTGACRMGELADQLAVSLSNLTAIVNRLANKGLVVRQRSDDDRRVVLVALTADGRKHQEQRNQARRRMASAMLGALDPSERKVFLRLMHKIVAQTAVGILVLAVLTTATGCSTVRRARTAQRPDDRQPGERTITAQELDLGSNTILTLDAVIRLALTNAPSVLEARANLAIAEAQCVRARAGYLPHLQGSASAGFEGQASAAASKTHNAGVGLTDDLISFGRAAAALRQAQAQREAARESLRSAENDTVYGACLAFFGLYRAQELLDVDEASVQDFQRHLDQVRVMAEIGTRIRYDVTKAEVDLGNARLTALTARHDVLNARAALSRALGLAEALPGDIAVPNPAKTEIGSRDALRRHARASNPDVLALLASVDAASAGVDAAIADLSPDLTVSAGYTWSGSHFPLARSWSLESSLGLDFFTGWRKTSAVDAAVAALRSARAAVADREQQLQQDLTTAFAGLDTARDRSALAELLVRQAREYLVLTSERYRLGLATSVELTDAEVAVTQTRSQQVEARYADWVARSQIRRYTGD